ncbi:MAG: YraN family protein, partial [Solirubrobacteraceae bacterium]
MSTSTHTWNGWTPSMANVATRASMVQRLREKMCHVGVELCQKWVLCRAFCVVIDTIRDTHVTLFGVVSSGMDTDPGHQLGREGEQRAAEHLARLGYEIVERNYRTRWGELDIVARAGRTLA